MIDHLSALLVDFPTLHQSLCSSTEKVTSGTEMTDLLTSGRYLNDNALGKAIAVTNGRSHTTNAMVVAKGALHIAASQLNNNEMSSVPEKSWSIV
jgi:hypothetical protein